MGWEFDHPKLKMLNTQEIPTSTGGRFQMDSYITIK